MNEGFYILIVVLVFALLYLDRLFNFLGADVVGWGYHVELLLLLGYVIYRIKKS